MLLQNNTVKTDSKKERPVKMSRKGSDVSLSESLYDSLFSEDDSKVDDLDSKRKQMKKSLDVSEVVTACLDDMAAKTGMTQIQKPSHMDRWLQKAKSKTPEKTNKKKHLVKEENIEKKDALSKDVCNKSRVKEKQNNQIKRKHLKRNHIKKHKTNNLKNIDKKSRSLSIPHVDNEFISKEQNLTLQHVSIKTASEEEVQIDGEIYLDSSDICNEFGEENNQTDEKINEIIINGEKTPTKYNFLKNGKINNFYDDRNYKNLNKEVSIEKSQVEIIDRIELFDKSNFKKCDENCVVDKDIEKISVTPVNAPLHSNENLDISERKLNVSSKISNQIDINIIDSECASNMLMPDINGEAGNNNHDDQDYIEDYPQNHLNPHFLRFVELKQDTLLEENPELSKKDILEYLYNIWVYEQPKAKIKKNKVPKINFAENLSKKLDLVVAVENNIESSAVAENRKFNEKNKIYDKSKIEFNSNNNSNVNKISTIGIVDDDSNIKMLTFQEENDKITMIKDLHNTNKSILCNDNVENYNDKNTEEIINEKNDNSLGIATNSSYKEVKENIEKNTPHNVFDDTIVLESCSNSDTVNELNCYKNNSEFLKYVELRQDSVMDEYPNLSQIEIIDYLYKTWKYEQQGKPVLIVNDEVNESKWIRGSDSESADEDFNLCTKKSDTYLNVSMANVNQNKHTDKINKEENFKERKEDVEYCNLNMQTSISQHSVTEKLEKQCNNEINGFVDTNNHVNDDIVINCNDNQSNIIDRIKLYNKNPEFLKYIKIKLQSFTQENRKLTEKDILNCLYEKWKYEQKVMSEDIIIDNITQPNSIIENNVQLNINKDVTTEITIDDSKHMPIITNKINNIVTNGLDDIDSRENELNNSRKKSTLLICAEKQLSIKNNCTELSQHDVIHHTSNPKETSTENIEKNQSNCIRIFEESMDSNVELCKYALQKEITHVRIANKEISRNKYIDNVTNNVEENENSFNEIENISIPQNDLSLNGDKTIDYKDDTISDTVNIVNDNISCSNNEKNIEDKIKCFSKDFQTKDMRIDDINQSNIIESLDNFDEDNCKINNLVTICSEQNGDLVTNKISVGVEIYIDDDTKEIINHSEDIPITVNAINEVVTNGSNDTDSCTFKELDNYKNHPAFLKYVEFNKDDLMDENPELSQNEIIDYLFKSWEYRQELKIESTKKNELRYSSDSDNVDEEFDSHSISNEELNNPVVLNQNDHPERILEISDCQKICDSSINEKISNCHQIICDNLNKQCSNEINRCNIDISTENNCQDNMNEIHSYSNDPDFLQYVELKKDALIEDNSKLSQKEILAYLYETWKYENTLKTEDMRVDDMKQLQLVKGQSNQFHTCDKLKKPKKALLVNKKGNNLVNELSNVNKSEICKLDVELNIRDNVTKEININDSEYVPLNDNVTKCSSYVDVTEVSIDPTIEIPNLEVKNSLYVKSDNNSVNKLSVNVSNENDLNNIKCGDNDIEEQSELNKDSISNNKDLNTKYNDPDFLKYVELKQDSIIDEHPELSQEAILEYLYNIWNYEQDLKTEEMKNDEIQQSHMIKGLDQVESKKSNKEKHKINDVCSNVADCYEVDKPYPSKDVPKSPDSIAKDKTLALNSNDNSNAKIILSISKKKILQSPKSTLYSWVIKNNVQCNTSVSTDSTPALKISNDKTEKTKNTDKVEIDVTSESYVSQKYHVEFNNGKQITYTNVKNPNSITEKTFNEATETSNGSQNKIPKKFNKTIDKYKDPEFLKYVELRQDALRDEYPDLSKNDIIFYLYKTWNYEEMLKSEDRKNDDIEQSKLVKGLGYDNKSMIKKGSKKKSKVEKIYESDDCQISKEKPNRRKAAKAYYNELDDYSDSEDDYLSLSMKQVVRKPVINIPEAEISEENREIADDCSEKSEYDVEYFFNQLTQPKPNVFKGYIREKVCEICERTSNLVKCKGCAGMFHVDCVSKPEKIIIEQPLIKGRKKKKPRGRKPKANGCNDSESQSDERNVDSMDDVDKSMDEIEDLDTFDLATSVDEFEAKASEKMKELLKDAESFDDSLYTSDEELNWKDSVAGQCEIVDIKLKPRIPDNNYANFKCKNCQKYDVPLCFVCKSVTSPKNRVEYRQKCNVAYCHKYYHLECLDHWPQTQFGSGEIKNGKNRLETITCPRHVCHTCVCDNPRGCKTRFSADKLAKCVRCPAVYHSYTKCLPAGTQILTASHVICPRHYEHK